MEIINCEQGSSSWFECRLGIFTASNFDKVITTKGEPSKQVKKYIYKVAGEYVSGYPEETYQNSAMARGIEMEEEARNLYTVIKGVDVEQVGFCLSDKGYGCSPDGLVGVDGMLEIKCPTLSVHVEYLLKGTLPSAYFSQVQGQLLVTGRKWCDFQAYYPGLKPLIVRVDRDAGFVKKLDVELLYCRNELEKIINEIK